MKFYHGATSPAAITEARDAAPEWSHGYGWTPEKMTPHDDQYFLDNGAFKAFSDNEVWDPEKWIGRIQDIPDMPREPDFVVLPDKVMDHYVTKARSYAWSQWLRDRGYDYPTAYAVQNGMDVEESVRYAKFELDADYIFVGGG